MKYRKPITNIRDRHVLIELDGDFTHDEIRHILNHAYLNHKAPYEYDEVKKYIRDLVIGEHNSVYIMYNGSPNPLASTSIFYPSRAYSNLTNYDYMVDLYNPNIGASVGIGYTNNATCTSTTLKIITSVSLFSLSVSSPSTYGYNNGTALIWELIYATTNFTSISLSSSSVLVVGPTNPNGIPYSGIKYAYAPYLTSNNPLTLSTYYYWEAPSVSFSHVYFNLVTNASGWVTNGSISSGSTSGIILVPIFYSQGNYSFNANTYYISMWQWTYT
jgi:hypothetical protein